MQMELISRDATAKQPVISDEATEGQKLVAIVTRGESTPWTVDGKILKITRKIFRFGSYFLFGKAIKL